MRRQAEAVNGTLAMIGLTAGLVVEGQTGKGILGQVLIIKYHASYHVSDCHIIINDTSLFPSARWILGCHHKLFYSIVHHRLEGFELFDTSFASRGQKTRVVAQKEDSRAPQSYCFQLVKLFDGLRRMFKLVLVLQQVRLSVCKERLALLTNLILRDTSWNHN